MQNTENTSGQLPGLLTYKAAVSAFENADDRYIELKSFPEFSKAARIKTHDSIVLAADTGQGKSSLAINFINDLLYNYPCIYFNLEMDTITVLRRLTAINTGKRLDEIQEYKSNKTTAATVNEALKDITSRKPLQVIQGVYSLENIKDKITESIKGREDPTVIVIDHALLIDTGQTDRYVKFTMISETLRKMAIDNNIIMFVILQQNRSGKEKGKRPGNDSLKETGSWENDATKVCFLWYDENTNRKTLSITKNRDGISGDFKIEYTAVTQRYKEVDFEPCKGPTPFDKNNQIDEKLQMIIQGLYDKNGNPRT